jgi:hypothetical protein
MPEQPEMNLVESVHYVQRLSLRDIDINLTEQEESIVNPNGFGVITIGDYEKKYQEISKLRKESSKPVLPIIIFLSYGSHGHFY